MLYILVDKLKKTSTIIITIEENFNLSTKNRHFLEKCLLLYVMKIDYIIV